MVKISHECPLSLMNKARQEWNDYDYCLVHLLDEHPEYLQFFRDSIAQGRHVILDNSIFELGTAFQPEPFAKWVIELKPTEYIVPDVLEDCQKTIDSFDNWLDTYEDLPGERIGVVQGKNYSELVSCYRYMSQNADKIAISFDYSYYRTIGLGSNKWQQYADGRQRFITSLVRDGIWNANIPHHLLGASVPQEFKLYAGRWDDMNITSLDTSNPVQQGLLGNMYTKDGLFTKNTLKVADSFDKVYPDDLIINAVRNVEAFRSLCGGE